MILEERAGFVDLRDSDGAGGDHAIEAEQQGQKAQQATAEEVTNFKKAFSVCLEAKKYMVKF